MSNVDHPKHYQLHPTGIECVDIAEHFNFNLGMAIKYIWRAGYKTDDPIEDLEKAAWCINREIEKIKKFGRGDSFLAKPNTSETPTG